MRALVCGWFSFDHAEVTAGDLLARDAVRTWLADAGVHHETATAAPFRRLGEVDLETVDPSSYSHLVFVCGPLAGREVEHLLARFAGCARLAVGVSVVDGTAALDVTELVARDDRRSGAPDLSMAVPTKPVPVVGLVQAHRQPEYGDRDRLEAASDAVADLLGGVDVAPLVVDIWLHATRPDLCHTPGQVESVLARCDAVVSTSLHGLVLGLKVGTPVLAVDPVAGGAKVSRQAEALRWPAIVAVDALRADVLRAHLEWCLSTEARQLARRCTSLARASLLPARDRLLSALLGPSPPRAPVSRPRSAPPAVPDAANPRLATWWRQATASKVSR